MVDKTDVRRPSPQPSITAGRRNLLKAIGATGIAVTASNAIPSEWVEPVMEVGYLPAHAQNSPLPQLPIASCIAVPAPADIMLTVDVSGSLAGDIGTARQALLAFVAARDLSVSRVGVISFDTEPIINLPLSQDKATIDEAINSLRSPGRNTSIASGVNAATAELTNAPVSGNPRVIILFSDGHANQEINASGVTPAALQEARDAASRAKAAGIRIITVGIDIGGPGSGVTDAYSLLRDMATSPSDFFFVENLSQLLAALSTGGICP